MLCFVPFSVALTIAGDHKISWKPKQLSLFPCSSVVIRMKFEADQGGQNSSLVVCWGGCSA